MDGRPLTAVASGSPDIYSCARVTHEQTKRETLLRFFPLTNRSTKAALMPSSLLPGRSNGSK